MPVEQQTDAVTSRERARHIAEAALGKKAHDITVLHLGSLSDVTDHFVLCTGDSDTHVKAIADAIVDDMSDSGEKVWRKEGYAHLQWILLDFVDVVVHVFQPKVRAYYDLERLWADAAMEHVEDEDACAR